VDGFRFDLASVMCRDGKGQPLEAPPIVRAIAKDPVLSQVPLPLLICSWLLHGKNLCGFVNCE